MGEWDRDDDEDCVESLVDVGVGGGEVSRG